MTTTIETKKIPFGICLNSKKHYNYCASEIGNFIECADSFDAETRDRYIEFLQDINLNSTAAQKSVKQDLDLLEIFADDLDNRADIDYREGHWDDEPEIVAGGKYFAQKAAQLKAHIAKYK